QLALSIRDRAKLRDITGDPWDGRSLEWATASPPPVFNFAALPDVHGLDVYWDVKQQARQRAELRPEPGYAPIELPRNSPTGFVTAFFATFFGFAVIWHIWWLAALGAAAAYAVFVVFAWRDRTEEEIPAEAVARLDRANREARRAALAAEAASR